jgi:hypothetical protein
VRSVFASIFVLCFLVSAQVVMGATDL